MSVKKLLTDYPITQSDEGKPEENADKYIAGKANDITSLQILYALVGKGRESRETAT